MGKNVGYARVSTADQDHASQVDALTRYGAEIIFSEKESGATTERAELKKALASLEPGDTLVVTNLDRLSRRTIDTLLMIDDLDKRGIYIHAIREGLNTSTPTGRMGVAISSIFAEQERRRILERTSEGLARARAKGVHCGRPPKLSNDQKQAALELIASGKQQSVVANLLSVSPATICMLVRDARERADQMLRSV